MSRARLIVSGCPEAGTTLRLTGDEAAHAKARRLAPGDAVTLVDGTGMEAQGRVVRMTSTSAEILVESLSRAAETDMDLTLAVAAVRWERLSWIAEKATELSVKRMIVVATDRSQRFRESAAGIARLRRVAREAAKQCESARWPEVTGPVPLREIWLLSAGQRFLLDASGAAFPERLLGSPIALLIGPEGGWTDDERTAAHANGWRSASLPAGKLRAETAAIAAIALARAAFARAQV